MTFHRIFGESASQRDVFEECGVKRLIEKAVEGYNATVFAYGQTGAGKTHTITGPDDIPFTDFDNELWGVIPRCLRYIFDLVSQKSDEDPGTRFSIRASYLEIYNEQVQDLLNPTNVSLPVRYNNEKGFFVENLFVVECEVLDDCMAVLEEGLRNRKVASHRLNERSSRSHGIMSLMIDMETVDPEDQRLIRKSGKLSFVDLAGSEKIKESKASGSTLTETLNINKSLLTLGICISALAEMKRKNKAGQLHVPYRDSKLTKLLSDTLGGNGIALMVACVSPASYNLNETLSTLRYAARAKYIQNKPAVQIDPREELIMRLRKQLKETQDENDKLRQMVSEFEQGVRGSQQQTKKKSDINEELYAQEKAMLTKFIEENRTLKSTNASLQSTTQKLSRENHDLIDENNNLVTKLEKLVSIFGAALDVEIKAAEESDANSKKGILGFLRGFGLSPSAGATRKASTSSEGDQQQQSATDQTMDDDNPTDLYAKKRVLLNTLDFVKRKHIDKSIGDLVFSDDETRNGGGVGDDSSSQGDANSPMSKSMNGSMSGSGSKDKKVEKGGGDKGKPKVEVTIIGATDEQEGGNAEAPPNQTIATVEDAPPVKSESKKQPQQGQKGQLKKKSAVKGAGNAKDPELQSEHVASQLKSLNMPSK